MPRRTRKVEINLGYRCNARCPFCYYYDSVVTHSNEETLSTEQAKEQLRLAKRLGIREIEFTGGEVTLRKDLPELVRYAKGRLGFEVVSLITNGIQLASRRYAGLLADAGVDDILFSVHGPDPDVHDSITGVPGSFHRIMTAIENATILGLRTRTNTVVCQANYRLLTELMLLLIEKRIDNVNFVMFNPVQQARHSALAGEVYVNYKDAGREIARAIQVSEPRLPHFNVRYLPFCFLPGYEHFVTNLDQMTFDPDEWDNYASFRIRKGRWMTWACLALGILNVPHLAPVVKDGLRTLCTAGLSRFYVLKDRVKTRSCRACAYEDVCDYLYRDYLEIYGDSDVEPVAGPKVRDPAWSMRAAGIRPPGTLPERARHGIPLLLVESDTAARITRRMTFTADLMARLRETIRRGNER